MSFRSITAILLFSSPATNANRASTSRAIAVWTFNPGHRIAGKNLRGARINGDQFVLFMHGNKDVARARVIDRIPSASSERDGRNQRIRRWVDDGIRVSVLVGNKHSLCVRRVCYAIWIVHWTDFSERLQALHIDNRNFMLSSHRSKYFAQLRHSTHE